MSAPVLERKDDRETVNWHTQTGMLIIFLGHY